MGNNSRHAPSMRIRMVLCAAVFVVTAAAPGVSLAASWSSKAAPDASWTSKVAPDASWTS